MNIWNIKEKDDHSTVEQFCLDLLILVVLIQKSFVLLMYCIVCSSKEIKV